MYDNFFEGTLGDWRFVVCLFLGSTLIFKLCLFFKGVWDWWKGLFLNGIFFWRFLFLSLYLCLWGFVFVFECLSFFCVKVYLNFWSLFVFEVCLYLFKECLSFWSLFIHLQRKFGLCDWSLLKGHLKPWRVVCSRTNLNKKNKNS